MRPRTLRGFRAHHDKRPRLQRVPFGNLLCDARGPRLLSMGDMRRGLLRGCRAYVIERPRLRIVRRGNLLGLRRVELLGLSALELLTGRRLELYPVECAMQSRRF